MRIQYFIRLCLLPFCMVLLFSLSACRPAQEQQENFLIGIINPNKGTQDINRGFINGMAESGYREGQNTTYITSASSFEMDQVIQDMVAREVDLIFTVTTPATRKAFEATGKNGIPIVFVMQDPVASGIIKSLAKPNGKITGVQVRGSVPKTVEWMLKISPDINHLFVPIKFDTKAAEQSLEDLKKTISALGIELTLVEVHNQSELDTALAGIPDDADAIFMVHSVFIHSNTEKLVQAAIDKKMLIGSAAAQSELGVTLSYGMIPEKTGRQASRMANLILSGRTPSDIPAEIADFFLGINLKTAGASKIEIPPSVLQQADIIIR